MDIKYTEERVMNTDVHYLQFKMDRLSQLVLTKEDKKRNVLDIDSSYWEDRGYVAAAIINFAYFQSNMMLGGMIEGRGLLTAPFSKHPNFSTLVLDQDNKLHITELNDYDDIMRAYKVEWSGQAGDALVKNGKPYKPIQPFAHSSSKNPRGFIGQLYDDTIIFYGTDCRSSNDSGFYMDDLRKIALEKGCKEAIAVDGGDSVVLGVYDASKGELKALNNNPNRPNYSACILYVKDGDITVIKDNNKPFRIGNDVGHHENTFELTGGKGFNTQTLGRYEEYHFTSAVGKFLSAHIKRHGMVEILGQQFDSNVEIGITDRTDIYNKENVDIVLSTHSDWNNNPDAKGHWAFYWGTSTMGSDRLAQIWDKYADKYLPTSDRPIQKSSLKQYNFGILRMTNSPAMLAEWAFSSNADDLKYLKSIEYQKLCAMVYMRTACEFLGVTYIEEDINEEPVINYKTKYLTLKEAINKVVETY